MKHISVVEATKIADKYDVGLVVIVAIDRKEGVVMTTTYGRNDAEKAFAADLGEKINRMAGGEPDLGERYEDFRPCLFCGKKLAEHEESRPEGSAVPRVPCLLLKSGYRPLSMNDAFKENCPRCIEPYQDEETGEERPGERKPSECQECGVCKDCEHMRECSKM